MKTLIKIVFSFAIISVLVTFPVQDTNATKPEARAEARAAKSILENYGYSVRSYFSEGVLDKGDYETFSRTFYRGVDYALVVGGCTYTNDIDIYVYDKYGDLVASDNSTKQYAITAFSANYTGTYYIKIKMYDSTSDGVHWALQYGYK